MSQIFHQYNCNLYYYKLSLHVSAVNSHYQTSLLSTCKWYITTHYCIFQFLCESVDAKVWYQFALCDNISVTCDDGYLYLKHLARVGGKQECSCSDTKFVVFVCSALILPLLCFSYTLRAMDCINLADRDKLQAVVNTEMNLQIP
jgi:hypothetical protein